MNYHSTCSNLAASEEEVGWRWEKVTWRRRQCSSRRCYGLRRLLLVLGGDSALSLYRHQPLFFSIVLFSFSLSFMSFVSVFSSLFLFFFHVSFFLLPFFVFFLFVSLFFSVFNYLIPSPKIFPPLYSSQNAPPSLFVVRPPKNSSFVPPDFSPLFARPVERGIYRTGETGATLPLSNHGDREGWLGRPLYSRLSRPHGMASLSNLHHGGK